ncbi:NAD/NADP octopine/nopaline dehydrogenase family protein [Mesorhizobium tianshanense]|uniref:NAD/NADP octopine/nopaline dehydrogenase-like protein n=1 Tax=Mesorhizobium tianshanense TaxID=39844 RepID=A0A562MH02_9HYPH|nr:NAD/NADP octopine/nopaline dehydrogenase family protein [Mesorhizobium tianshanense]TWI19169.1 NAD/NADP octopine/nopaline dehydrogenase-like protein [Mesorhizobium tianshanense]
MRTLKVCICGGGRTAHLYAALFSHVTDVEVSVYTQKAIELCATMPPKGLLAVLPDGREYQGRPQNISNNPCDTVVGAEVVILAVPAHVRAFILTSIAPFVDRHHPVFVGAIPGNAGFDWLADRMLPPNVVIWGTKDPPYTAYDLVHGISVAAGGGPRTHVFACHKQGAGNQVGELQHILEHLFQVDFILANSFLELTLAFGNPVLHLPALYGLVGPHSDNPDAKFTGQQGWWRDLTELGAAYIEDCAAEQYQLIKRVRAELGCNLASLTPLRDDLLRNYQDFIADGSSLHTIFKTNRAFKGMVPLVRAGNGIGFEIDFSHRIFYEDTHFGLSLLVAIARRLNVDMPRLEEIAAWAETLSEPLFGRATDYLPPDFPQNASDIAVQHNQAPIVAQTTRNTHVYDQ